MPKFAGITSYLKFFTTLFWLALTVTGFAQKTRTLKTHIVNFDHKPIENAYALLYTETDSVLVQTKFSDKKGLLELDIEVQTAYYCIFSKDSFTSRQVSIKKDKPELPDTIHLETNFQKETVMIFASPIVIKEDTVQFNNELFKKDSIKTLEEVLKKFPGVTIDREGNIEINGQKVTEILLEGKPLPITDIKSFTQTLQAGLIDKIQFIDRKSDETKITKIDNGKRDKVINIKLKSKNKKSLNKDLYAGIGNNNRYEGRASIQYLNNDFFSNAALNLNNTGRSGYGNISYFNPSGISSGANAYINTRYTGLKKWTFGLNTSFANQKTIFDESRDRLIFLKDSLNYYQQKLSTTNNNKTFNSNLIINFTPDSLGDFKFNLSTNVNDGNNNRIEFFNTLNNSKIKINEGGRNNNGDNNRFSISANLTGGRTLLKNKTSFFTSLSYSNNNSNDITFQENDILYFRTTGTGYDTTKQQIKNSTKGHSFRGNINFYQSIMKELKLSLGTGINFSNRPTNRKAYLYNYANQQYEIPNTVLFNDNLNLTNIFSQSIGLVYKKGKHNFNSTLSFNQQINKNIDKIRDTTLLQNNKYLTPSFSYTYIDKILILDNSVTLSQRNPTSQQLQPIIDNSNPLFVRKGNPDLKNEQTVNLNTTITKKPSKKGLSINITNTAIIVSNKIANNTYFDPADGKQVSIPINLPKAYSSNLSLSVNKYLEKKKLNISARLNTGISRDNNFLNGELNKLNNFNIRPNLGVKLNRKKYYFDYSVGYLYQTNKYSLRPSQNIELGNFTTDASLTLIPGKNVEITFDYQQTVNNNKRSIQKINNLNGRISFTPNWKKPKTTFAISIFDILNQNSNLRQNINDYYEEYVTTNAIRRFLLFTVNVKLNKFKVKKTKEKI